MLGALSPLTTVVPMVLEPDADAASPGAVTWGARSGWEPAGSTADWSENNTNLVPTVVVRAWSVSLSSPVGALEGGLRAQGADLRDQGLHSSRAAREAIGGVTEVAVEGSDLVAGLTRQREGPELAFSLSRRQSLHLMEFGS